MTFPSSTKQDDYDKKLRNVFFSIGQSVYLYQNIEVLLKTLLPHLRPKDGITSDDPFAEMNRLLTSRETLGPLMERLKEATEVDHPEGFANYLEQIVRNRNELVHTFLRLAFGNLSSTTSCDEALAYLESRRAYALPLMHLLREMLSKFVELLADCDVNAEGSESSSTGAKPTD